MTIAEVEEIVEIGEIPPDHVHVPSIYVQKVVKGTRHLLVCVRYWYLVPAPWYSICHARVPSIYVQKVVKGQYTKK